MYCRYSSTINAAYCERILELYWNETLSDDEENYQELINEQFLIRIELKSAGGTFHRIMTTCCDIRLSIKRSNSKS